MFLPEGRAINKRKLLWRILIWTLAGFVIANLLVWGIYHGRTYPKTKIAGQKVGSISYGAVATEATKRKLLPTNIVLTDGNHHTQVNLSDLGIATDSERTLASLKTQEHSVPILNFLATPDLKAPVKIDDTKFRTKASSLTNTFHSAPTEPRINLQDGAFKVVAGADGHELDINKLKDSVFKSLDAGQANVKVPLLSIAPKTDAGSLKSTATRLQREVNTTLTYRYQDKQKKLGSNTIVSWFVPQDNSYVLSDFAMRTSIFNTGKEIGVVPGNLDEATKQTVVAVTAGQPLTFDLKPFDKTVQMNYCVSSRGIDDQKLSALKSQLSSTYNDLRGWSLQGQVQFKLVDSGCDFTVWLASADQMPTFGAICDTYWNCDVGKNVIINYARWTSTSDSWRAYGGSLADYQTMAINHETGHMLGFGHDMCPAPGQPAPVMMQESINLQGCTFNIWPLDKEQAALRQKLNL